ncbi:hypothetical protein [Corynebacterium sp. AOP12-C2-36]|uniref:hypothetical protein n=1 Tax=Corynebacterium sp. AOP12-C2-36 TaxID=3457723 RepID=UPI004033D556
MTPLETILTLSLLVVVPWAVWSAIDLIALRRDVRGLGADVDRLDGAVDYLTSAATLTEGRIDGLLEWRSHTADLDVPTVDEPEQPTTPTYRPVPDDFHTNR